MRAGGAGGGCGITPPALSPPTSPAASRRSRRPGAPWWSPSTGWPPARRTEPTGGSSAARMLSRKVGSAGRGTQHGGRWWPSLTPVPPPQVLAPTSHTTGSTSRLFSAPTEPPRDPPRPHEASPGDNKEHLQHDPSCLCVLGGCRGQRVVVGWRARYHSLAIISMGWISPSPPSGDNPIRVTLRMSRNMSHFSKVRGIAELQTHGFHPSSPGGWPIPSRLLAGFSHLYRSWLVTVPLCWLIPSPTRVTLRPSRPVSPLLLGRRRIPSHHLSLWREHPSGERRWRWDRNVHTRITKTTGAPPAMKHQKRRQKGAPSPLSLLPPSAQGR